MKDKILAEFDKFAENLLIEFISDGEDEVNLYLSDINMGYDGIKYFISTALDKVEEEARKQVIGEIEKMKFKPTFSERMKISKNKPSYWNNKVIEYVISTLTKERKDK